jgi:hypothetical protein
MLKMTMLLLTLTAGGDIRVTLSEAESAQDCADSLEVVSQVLAESGNPPLAGRCAETALRLTPFEHGVAPEDEIHRYRVILPAAGGFAVEPLAADAACTPAPQADPAVFCARSGQSVRADG